MIYLRDIDATELTSLLGRFGLALVLLGTDEPIPGSWFGEPEAGLVGLQVFVRPDTPLHSALHEACHVICMDGQRRAQLHTNAGGDYDEENAVNYLEILLAERLTGIGAAAIMADMDEWGYTFRLGSARAWFEEDAADALSWLRQEGVVDADGQPTWQLRH